MATNAEAGKTDPMSLLVGLIGRNRCVTRVGEAFRAKPPNPHDLFSFPTKKHLRAAVLASNIDRILVHRTVLMKIAISIVPFHNEFHAHSFCCPPCIDLSNMLPQVTAIVQITAVVAGLLR